MGNNKKIHIKNLIVLIIIVILLIIGITITMSRYGSTGKTTLSADIAFFVLEDWYQSDDLVANIFLENLYPREETFDYLFTVANTDGTKTAETAIKYTVEMEVTTNLPLEFEIYKDGTKLINAEDIENEIVLDSTRETYIRKITIKSGSFNYNVAKTDTYKIAVEFPIEYATNEEFENMIDNINIKLDTGQKLDSENPTILITPQENTTWAKSHTATVTIADEENGLAAGAQLQYGWSKSLSTEPTVWKDATIKSYLAGEPSTTFTATGSGLDGKQYLWVKPINLKDLVGNERTLIAKSTGAFYFDNQNPIISLSSQTNTAWAQSHSVTVAIEDEGNGLATGAELKYGWSTSDTTGPRSYTTVKPTGYSAGTNNAVTFNATTPNGLESGKYYLWVVPVNVKDVTGNMLATTPEISTGTFYVDNTQPIISLSATGNATWSRSHNATITIEDIHSGLAAGAQLEYQWVQQNSDGTVGAPNSNGWASTTIAGYQNGTNSATFTVTGTNLTGKYNLYVKTQSVKVISLDSGNELAAGTIIISEEVFWFDNTKSTISLNSQGNTTWSHSQSVTVTIADSHSGLAAGADIQYGWTTSLDTEPTVWKTAIMSYSSGNASTTFTVTENGLSGKYYLWVNPITLKDVVGNTQEDATKSTATFYFDNTKPTISLSSQGSETSSQTHSVTVTIADSYSGLATGAQLQYGWSTSNTVEPENYTTVKPTGYSSGTGHTTFTATGSGLTGEYYLWVKPVTVKDLTGNTQTETIKSESTFYFESTE